MVFPCGCLVERAKQSGLRRNVVTSYIKRPVRARPRVIWINFGARRQCSRSGISEAVKNGAPARRGHHRKTGDAMRIKANML
jgi:hypothetical protein